MPKNIKETMAVRKNNKRGTRYETTEEVGGTDYRVLEAVEENVV